MDNEQKIRLEMQRADNAKELLNNPLYQEAIVAMKAAMFNDFQNTTLQEENIRHELWQRMQLLKDFEGFFESIVKKGVRAEQTLTMITKTP